MQPIETQLGYSKCRVCGELHKVCAHLMAGETVFLVPCPKMPMDYVWPYNEEGA